MSYPERLARARAREKELARISLRYSIARFLAGLGIAACSFGLLLGAAGSNRGWLFGAGASFVGFVALAIGHDRALKAERRAAEMAKLQEEALARLRRDWSALPKTDAPQELTRATGAREVGLFGDASLFRLLSTASTPPGRTTLAAWLVHGADPAEIERRQGAVRELAPQLDLRQDLELAARDVARAEPDIERFLTWAEGDPWLLNAAGHARPLLWTARGLAIATLGILPFVIFGPLPFSAWAILPLVNFAVGHLSAGKMATSFDRVSARSRELFAYAAVFSLFERERFESPKLVALKEATTADGQSASAASGAIDLLRRRLDLSESRRSEPIHFLLQSLCLWDFHVLAALERWQLGPGRRARGWLVALGEIEALAAMAALAHDEPTWAFPRLVTDGPPRLVARELGHPLIAHEARVGNDLEIGPRGTFLLVTGSNMSGKSTLLRAIATNVALAQAGAPCCAREMTLPPLDLGASLSVEDSLADGVSFFLAELRRLRAIVDAAGRAKESGRTLLFLLDEILRGTNSAERRIAVREVLLRLLDLGAIGAISSHDLALAEVPELRPALISIHFRESFEGEGAERKMTFDYRLRPGVAPTTNALVLLEMVGLGEGSARG